MIEPNILPEFEQPEAPKQQEKEQPKTGGAPESSEEVEGQQPKSAEAAELKAPANQEHKTRPAADPAAMIRDAEPRLIRKLIEMGLQGDFRAITYLLDHSRHVDLIKLGNIQIADDGVENLRKLVNAYNTGKIGVTEAKAVSRLLEAFVKAAIALDAKVGLAALQRQVDYNQRMLLQLMSLEKESLKGGGNKRR
jgi:hypothetical protein